MYLLQSEHVTWRHARGDAGICVVLRCDMASAVLLFQVLLMRSMKMRGASLNEVEYRAEAYGASGSIHVFGRW